MGTKTNTCRVCDRDLFREPLLRYENMPAMAQDLPEAGSLKDDKGVSLDVWQCSGCGLVQLNSEPVPYYKEVIRASAFSDDMRAFREKQFHGFVKKYDLNLKKIVELGCGRGEYLSLMQKCGVDAYGLEYSDGSVSYCIDNGMKASKGFVDSTDCKLDNAPFDAFFMMNFLEHLPHPNATLKGIYNNLADNSIGLIEVPNFDMMIQKGIFSEFISDHLFYFTKETLSTTLALNGFEVVECNEIWYDYIISAVVKKRGKLDIKEFYEYQTNLKKEIEEYIGRYGDNKVAVWGAGHQSFAVLSLSGLSGRIKYVVDSAEFKQGKYTPCTHIPIVSPDRLEKEPVDAVIVMAGGYSDEVVKNIKQRYNKNINIAVLRGWRLLCQTNKHN